MQSVKIPPQAAELEACVIGAILTDKDAIIEVTDILTAEMFYREEYAAMYAACLKLNHSGKGIDVLTVTEQLKKDNTLETAGGYYKVTQVTSYVASAAHIVEHALIIRQKHIRRELIKLSQRTEQDAYDESIEDLEVLSNHEANLEKIGNNASLTGEKSMVQVLTAILSDKSEVRGVPIVNPAKNIVHAYGNSDLIILAARPSMGKTAYAMQIAKETAKQGIATAVFSLEMSAEQLVARLVCSESEIYLDKIVNNNIHEYDQKRFKDSIGIVENLPIYIDDTAALSIYELKSRAARMKRKYGIGLIVIDYIQLMRGEQTKNGNREQEISSISRGLKVIAKTLGVPVIALSQLSRKCEERGDKRPMLSDLRESGAIEQDADVVQFLYRPEYYGIGSILTDDGEMSSAGIAEIITAKNRNGSVGSSFATWTGQFMKFGFVEQMSKFIPVAKVIKDTDTPF